MIKEDLFAEPHFFLNSVKTIPMYYCLIVVTFLKVLLIIIFLEEK